MRLIKRVSGLVTANLNDLVDQCENPEKMLKQAVREMETALGQLMDGAARAIAHHRLLVRQLDEQRVAVERRLKAAETAVANSDDATARRELRLRAECQQLAEGLQRQAIKAKELSERLRTQVSAMRVKLAEARRKLVDVTARNRAAAAQRRFVENRPSETCLSTAWNAFEASCNRIEQSEAETEALMELLGETEGVGAVDAEVEAELRALKEKTSHVVT